MDPTNRQKQKELLLIKVLRASAFTAFSLTIFGILTAIIFCSLLITGSIWNTFSLIYEFYITLGLPMIAMLFSAFIMGKAAIKKVIFQNKDHSLTGTSTIGAITLIGVFTFSTLLFFKIIGSIDSLVGLLQNIFIVFLFIPFLIMVVSFFPMFLVGKWYGWILRSQKKAFENSPHFENQ